MKRKFDQELREELRGARVSDGLRRRILAAATDSRRPSARRDFSMMPLTVAAAAVVVIALTAGALALRAERPDLSSPPLTAGQGGSNAGRVWLGSGRYHADSACGGAEEGGSARLDEARAKGYKGCAACIPENSAAAQGLVWTTGFGIYYHAQPDCSGQEDALGLLELEAVTLGKEPCPVCMAERRESGEPMLAQEPADGSPAVTLTPMPSVEYISATLPPKVTEQPEEPALTDAPAGMPDPTEELPSVQDWPVEQPSATFAPAYTAAPADGEPEEWNAGAAVGIPLETTLWMDGDGMYCHLDPDCALMEDGKQVTGWEADAEAQQFCPECMAGRAAVILWAGEDEPYCHLSPDCGELEPGEPEMCSAWDAYLANREVCPVCINGAQTPVLWDAANLWAAEEDPYYHCISNCEELGSAEPEMCTAWDAYLMRRTPCPVCMNGMQVPALWAARDGAEFHIDPACAALEGSPQITDVHGDLSGKAPCSLCVLDSRTDLVWAAQSLYYHGDFACSGMTDALPMCEAYAKIEGREPCPVCVGAAEEPVLWMTPGGQYYHAYDSCSGMRGAEPVAKMEAVLSGREACPTCMERTVWVSDDGVQYVCHAARNCMGMTEMKEIVLAPGEFLDMDQCSLCWNTIPVWMEPEGAFYHWDEHCSGMADAMQISEIEAIDNLGAAPCPICLESLWWDASETMTYDAEIAVSMTEEAAN